MSYYGGFSTYVLLYALTSHTKDIFHAALILHTTPLILARECTWARNPRDMKQCSVVCIQCRRTCFIMLFPFLPPFLLESLNKAPKHDTSPYILVYCMSGRTVQRPIFPGSSYFPKGPWDQIPGLPSPDTTVGNQRAVWISRDFSSRSAQKNLGRGGEKLQQHGMGAPLVDILHLLFPLRNFKGPTKR